MTDYQEPIFDIAQLAHVEMLSPDPAATEEFFVKYLGLQVTHREGQSTYLPALEESQHSSLIITESAEPGLGHVAWRAQSPQALERRVTALERSDYAKGWIDGAPGHGRAFQFTSTDGHQMEVFWEVERAQIPDDLRSPLKNRPQKRPTTGVPVRRIDHVNLMSSNAAADTRFIVDNLGFRTRERIVAGSEPARTAARQLDERQSARPRAGDHAGPQRGARTLPPCLLLVRRPTTPQRRGRSSPRSGH